MGAITSSSPFSEPVSHVKFIDNFVIKHFLPYLKWLESFSTRMSSLTSGATEPPIQSLLWVFSPSVKQPEPEADHSPLSCTEVKNGWNL